MDTYTLEFYDLISRALGGNDNKRLQGYLDEVLAVKYNGLQIDGFKFAEDMQLDFTYEQLQKEVGLNVMAQYVDLDSPAIPLGGEGVQIATGKIPRMKLVEYFNEDKVRKQMILEQRFGGTSDRVINSAKDKLFVTLDKLIGGHTNSLTYQRHQVVSRGKFVLTDTNNPNGIVNQTFAAHIPTANITNLAGDARWWTSVRDGVYSTEGSACDPIKDLKAIVRKAKDKGVKGHFEIDDAYAEQVLDHSKIREAIALRLYPLSNGDALVSAKAAVANMEKEAKLAELGKIIGAPIKTIDSLVSVEKWDNDRKKLVRPTFRAFEANVLVFVPDGSLGEILTVEPISMGGTVATYYEGRLMLTVGVDYVKKCQSFNTEMTSLVVPDKPQYMWYIHPYTA
jgi:hypothetical protein